MTTCIHTNIINKDNSLSEVFIHIENGIVCGISSMPSKEAIDCMDSILGSCYFNIHCHLGESLYVLDHSKIWSVKHYIKYTEKLNAALTINERDRLWIKSAMLAASQQSKVGVSGICAARSADISKRYGLNNMAGYPIMNSVKLQKFKNDGLSGFLNFQKKHKSESCNVGLFFHSLYSNDINSLLLAKECMENGAEFLSIHLSEDIETREMELRAFGEEPALVLDQYGLLNDKTIIVHGGYLSDNELSVISERGATIAVCPISNEVLNTKLPNLYKLIEKKINWCVSTDGLTTGKTFSLIGQIDALRKVFPDILPSELYDACTNRCAKLFNRCIYTGRIEVGTEARFIRYKSINKNRVFEQIISTITNFQILKF